MKVNPLISIIVEDTKKDYSQRPRRVENSANVTGEDVNATSFDIVGKVSALWTKMGKTGQIIFYISAGAVLVIILGFIIFFNRARIMSKIPRINISIKQRRFSKK